MAQVFSDTNGINDGLIQECEDITNLGAGGISGVTAKLKTFTRRLNQGLDRFYTLAFQYDTLWNWDGSNQTNLPIATTALNSGQQAYQFADELLGIDQVFAKDSNGVFHELLPQDDRTDPKSYTLVSDSGTPTNYELSGNSILPVPTPNYNSSAGFKVKFKRNGVKFAYTDGSIAIGIPSLFFKYLCNYASYPFLVEKSLKHANAVKQLIIEDESAIRLFISNRAKPKRAGLRVVVEDNR